MAAFFTARRGFHETATEAVLTIFAKGVPDESAVELVLDDAGRTLQGQISVPGRGQCRFKASLTAAVAQHVAVTVSTSRVKVELTMQKRTSGVWGSLGQLVMQEPAGAEAPPHSASAASAPPHCLVRIPLVGLQNTGNTCFMNSVLQCVGAVEELQLYFRTRRFARDVNTSNTLGLQGRLAHGYAKLLDHMLRRSSVPSTPGGSARASQAGSLAPRELKALMGLYQKRFDGTSQHDASEFLTFLLDGLHEDLNRIRQKPAYQELDSDDDEVEDNQAKIAKFWEWWQSRTSSAISDLFQGVIQVERRCVECGRVRKSFDACWNVQCELPRSSRNVGLGVIVTFADPRRQPLALGVVTLSTESVQQLTTKIATLAGIEGECLILADMFGGYIRHIKPSKAKATGVAETESKRWKDGMVIRGYEMRRPQPPADDTRSSSMTVCVVHMPPTERELLDSQLEVSDSDMSDPGRLKTLGNNLFKAGELALATDTYSRAIAALRKSAGTDIGERRDMLVSCLLNRSSCNLKLREMAAVLSDTTMALDILDRSDMSNEGDDSVERDRSLRMKSHYRRGQALAAMKCSDARAELLSAAKLGPSDKQVRAAYAATKQSAKAWEPYQSSFVRPHFVTIPVGNAAGKEMPIRDIYKQVWSSIAGEQEEVTELGISISVLHADDSSFPFACRDPHASARRVLDPVAMNSDSTVAIAPGSNLCVSWGATAWKKWHGAEAMARLSTDLSTLPSFQQLAEVGEQHVPRNAFDLRQWCPLQHVDSVAQARTCQSRVSSIYDCIRLHMGKEHMSGADQAYCNRCKQHQDSVREQRIAIAPKFLVVTLKRFGHDGHAADMMQRMFGGHKIGLPIELPLDGFDLAEFMAQGSEEPRPYDLIACVNHFGMVIGGHYTACARHGDNWYGFDDDDVSELAPGIICPPTGNTAGYVLIFRQRAPR
jgi:ubiquitin C-terminal hydrolase